MTAVDRHSGPRGRKAGRRTSLGLLVAAGLALSACQGGIDSVFPKAEAPIPASLLQKMKAKGMKPSSPILLRIYKSENVLEVWKQRDTGRYALLETYEICKWSGKLGPKFKEGDRQAPEGFYRVGKAQMNPNSDYHLSFNIGFPNTYDRSHGRTGSHLMVHGACSSAGCYSMTDEYVQEIYTLAREAFKGGQDYFQVQAYPFRMTAANLAKHAGSEHFDFWKMLKEGSDHFELTNFPPKVDVCERRYVFNREAEEGKEFRSSSECPPVTMPQTLLSSWKQHLEKEQNEFKRALKRHKLLGTYKETALADADVETISMMAKGSEILPPPTPRAEPPEPAVSEEKSEPAVASAGDDTLPGVATASENEAALSGSSETKPAEAATSEAVQESTQTAATNAAVTEEPAAAASVEAQGDDAAAPQGDEPRVNVVRAIPVPERAPRNDQSAAAQQPASQEAVASVSETTSVESGNSGVSVEAPVEDAAAEPPKKKTFWQRLIGAK